MDDYFCRPEVSNSDLTWLKNELYPSEMPDPEYAFSFGNLLDAMVTEPEKVDHFNFTCGDDQFTQEEFEKARQMKKAFMKDELCQRIFKASEFQKVMAMPSMKFDYDVPFSLPVRCKWDFWMPSVQYGADLKSTVATTQKQFEDAARYFDYDRQRFFYMNIARAKQDLLIGISKENFHVFKIPIRQGDDFWKAGREKALELAFRYFLLIHS
jgi:hypothetical protein